MYVVLVVRQGEIDHEAALVAEHGVAVVFEKRREINVLVAGCEARQNLRLVGDVVEQRCATQAHGATHTTGKVEAP